MDGGSLEKRRKSPVKSRSIRLARLPRREQERAALANQESERHLPTVRGECAGAERPCPHVGCRHHLYLDVSPYTGTIKINFPALEVWELEESCALDVAENGGMRLEDVGVLLNVTRERARQIEVQALVKLGQDEGVMELVPDDLLLKPRRKPAY